MKPLSKTLASPALLMNHARMTVLIALFALTLFFLLGCQRNENGQPVEYGPEEDPQEILDALNAPMLNYDPLEIKVGELVYFAETQELNGGAAWSVLAEVTQTVVERTETATEVQLTLLEDRINHGGEGKQSKVSREFKTTIEKNPTAQAYSPVEALGRLAQGSLSMAAEFVYQEQPSAHQALISSALRPFAEVDRVSYHNLKTSITSERPPEKAIPYQPGCSSPEAPTCRISVHRISYDQVVWYDDSTSERISIALARSPSVPYLAAELNRCVTLMVPVGESGSRVLLTQCAPVIKYRFESETP